MIYTDNDIYVLSTEHTSYIFRVMPSGQLEHLYYGRKLRHDGDFSALIETREFLPGNNNVYSDEYKNITLNDICLETGFEGKGDNRQTCLSIIHDDGSRTSDFRFVKAEKVISKPEMKTLPGSYGDAEGLRVVLSDANYGIRLVITYYVYIAADVITRTTEVINDSTAPIRIERIMSGQLDLEDHNYVMSTFDGAWAREMRRHDTPLISGSHESSAFTGTSSSKVNPFFMLSRPGADEDRGDVYGFNLIYSGNHKETAEISEFGKLRVLWGINDRAFSFRVDRGESFEAPEAVMTFSCEGFNGMSRNMHYFVRNHIVRGEWAHKIRPVLLNSWEAAYFDINEKKLLRLAKAAKDVGIELFVMDDGWFGERDSDDRSLGDWVENKKKLPGGVSGLADKIHEMGMSFGIWVEPEMVNVNSRLYGTNPTWTIDIPDKPHSEGRNQRILDMGREDVQDYVIKSMSRVFSSAKIDYVKWDMNRTFTDVYSRALDAERQGEMLHRYVIGLYRCMKELTERFPGILFEGCSAGGNRFDLGILCYFPQIWGSDDTDAAERVETETGYSYGYPLNTVGCHVSGVPNHQTLRITPLSTRFNVAAFGSLGYECNLCDMSADELSEIREQIELYKKWRSLLQTGTFYRGRRGNVTEWMVVSTDKTKAVGMLMRKLTEANSQHETFTCRGLDTEKRYHFYNIEKKINIKEFGDLVNTASPIHIKQNSVTQSVVSKFVKLDGETEDVTAYGDTLMYGGVRLKPAYAGTGFNDKTRVFPDFASRMYFVEETE